MSLSMLKMPSNVICLNQMLSGSSYPLLKSKRVESSLKDVHISLIILDLTMQDVSIPNVSLHMGEAVQSYPVESI